MEKNKKLKKINESGLKELVGSNTVLSKKMTDSAKDLMGRATEMATGKKFKKTNNKYSKI